jgi:hypothetical protein
MTLLKSLKTEAAALAQKTQEIGGAGRAKLDQAEARLAAHGLYRDLGTAVYAERTGKAGPDNAGEVDRLVAEITHHEATHSSASVASPKAPAARTRAKPRAAGTRGAKTPAASTRAGKAPKKGAS